MIDIVVFDVNLNESWIFCSLLLGPCVNPVIMAFSMVSFCCITV